VAAPRHMGFDNRRNNYYAPATIPSRLDIDLADSPAQGSGSMHRGCDDRLSILPLF
jgi:hypothetical protein